MNTEKIILNEERNVTLTAYLQPAGGEFQYIEKRPAILVLPGGGYTMCSDREADPIVFPYLNEGYQAFILRYSLGKDSKWPAPLNDYEQAMEYIRTKSEEWHLYTDKIAVIGFSAGGHLTGCAATMAKNKPNAAILGYAALEGETITGYHSSAPDVISQVNGNTCPCFVFTSRTDNMIPVRNSIKFISALTEHDISYESHIYAYGPHGFSTCNNASLTPGSEHCSRIPHWVEDSIAWLKDVFGDFSFTGMSEPKCKSHINGNKEETLNVDCTVAYLKQNKAAWQMLQPMMESSSNTYAESLPEPEEDAPSMNMDLLHKSMTLREILGYGGTASEIIEQMNANLNQIPNIIK